MKETGNKVHKRKCFFKKDLKKKEKIQTYESSMKMRESRGKRRKGKNI